MKKTHIVVHHSATKDGATFSWGVIRRYHTVDLGWRDIGYHFGIEQVGDYHEVIFGRWPDEDGAHCKDMNMNSIAIGICVVGNYDEQVPTLGAWGKAVELVKRLVKLYDIPIENILGHREVQEMAGIPPEHRKTCPGKTFHMDDFRAAVRASF